ncbi:MAG: hypothetical protein JWR85_579 [Marmoricola sp.]|nr:hypothetical protein [Marmoricola sp.]
MPDLADFAQLVPLDHGLCVVVPRLADLSPHSSVVNAGVVRHPSTGLESVAFVSVSTTRKPINLRLDPTIAVVIRAGWQRVSVEGASHPGGTGMTHHSEPGALSRTPVRESRSRGGPMRGEGGSIFAPNLESR